jgi:3-oxoacyl-[acyl-carrier-protein] synthase-3
MRPPPRAPGLPPEIAEESEDTDDVSEQSPSNPERRENCIDTLNSDFYNSDCVLSLNKVFSPDGEMTRSRVVATGKALGSERVDNATLAARLGTSPVSIERRTGIKSRYWVTGGETTSDLAVRAAQEALDRAGWAPSSIDLIVLSTTSPDYPFPSTACLVQNRLTADRAYAFDLNASCSGFLYALSVADHAIRSGGARRALVIASEVKSPFLKEDDLSTQILFGDGWR